MKRTLFFAMLAGFVAGAGSSATYLLMGGRYVGSIPGWAEILFYPGFLAGNWTYDQTIKEVPAKAVGVVAVGFAYAVLGGLGWWVRMWVRRSGTSPGSGEGNSAEIG